MNVSSFAKLSSSIFTLRLASELLKSCTIASVDDEPARDRLLVLVGVAQPGVAFGAELVGEIGELLAREQQASESRRIEPFHPGADHELVRVDAAAAIDLAARVGQFQVRGFVLSFAGRLIAQRVGQVLVERAIPRTLNQPARRRVIPAGGDATPACSLIGYTDCTSALPNVVSPTMSARS